MALASPAPIDVSVEYFDLGPFSFPISTSAPAAQVWFDRGLLWAFAFNHDEATFCFEQAVAHDPNCAMGYWGIAYASGPNYNKAWAAFDTLDLKTSLAKCQAAASRAHEVAAMHTSLFAAERGLIEAIPHRFPVTPSADGFALSAKTYAERMRRLHSEIGLGELTITTLAVDALMNMAPWQLFEPRTGRPNPDTPVEEIGQLLAVGMKLDNADTHPGILHMYIHYMEMSRTPEAAINAADKLRHLMPDAGHMLHMPSHIDFLVGDYRKAIESNARAIVADEHFFAKRPHRLFYKIYLLHNYHSLIYAAMMGGQLKEALEGCDGIERTVTKELLQVESPPMADWVEAFLSVRIHVLVRFGKWDLLKQLSVPEDKETYCVLTAWTHYGRAVAMAATSEDAAQEQKLFHAAVDRVPETRLDFPNKVVDILQVGKAMLMGEVEYRQGNYSAAFESLREAIKRDDSLVYSEPWAWMLPARHPYGALLLEQGHVEEAAQVYAQDLGLDGSEISAHHHPNNIWGLHGYHECLTRLGRTSEANIINQALTKLTAMADVPVSSSCFCRLDVAPKCCRNCESQVSVSIMEYQYNGSTALKGFTN